MDPPTRFELWPFWRRWFGQRSERFAARWLTRQGYKILAANIATRNSEIDLIALAPDQQTLVVVEVRSVSSADPQLAADSVNLTKQRKLTLAAIQFCQTRHLSRAVIRFDVLALSWPVGQTEPKILHLPHAFEAVSL